MNQMSPERRAQNIYLKLVTVLKINLSQEQASVVMDALRGEVEEILRHEREEVVKELVDEAFLLKDSPKKTACLELARNIKARIEKRR
jgi:hypothetical protein